MAFTYDNVPYFGSGRLGSLAFVHQNIATSAASTAMKISDVAGVTQFAMPYDGQILGIAGCGNANITAGTIRVIPSINGATISALVATNAATSVKVVSAVSRSANQYDTSTLKFSAGDRLGVKLSTTANYAPNTDDWTANLVVEYRINP